MRICVFGAGSIGGNFATRLAAGNDVSVVARGRHLKAIRAPLAFARSAGIDTPTLDTIEPLCVSLAVSKGLYAL